MPLFRIFLLVLCGLLLPIDGVSCSVDIPPLRKDFRWAKKVFLAEVVDVLEPTSDITRTKDRQISGLVKIKVEKGWKGTKASEVSLLSDVGGSICPGDFDFFKKGERYLIFAENDYVSYTMATKFQNAAEKIKRLNNPWFRVWARIYPF